MKNVFFYNSRAQSRCARCLWRVMCPYLEHPSNVVPLRKKDHKTLRHRYFVRMRKLNRLEDSEQWLLARGSFHLCLFHNRARPVTSFSGSLQCRRQRRTDEKPRQKLIPPTLQILSKNIEHDTVRDTHFILCLQSECTKHAFPPPSHIFDELLGSLVRKMLSCLHVNHFQLLSWKIGLIQQRATTASRFTGSEKWWVLNRRRMDGNYCAALPSAWLAPHSHQAPTTGISKFLKAIWRGALCCRDQCRKHFIACILSST